MKLRRTLRLKGRSQSSFVMNIFNELDEVEKMQFQFSLILSIFTAELVEAGKMYRRMKQKQEKSIGNEFYLEILNKLIIRIIMSNVSKKHASRNEWDGNYYKKHSVNQYQSALKILEQIHFKGDEQILDVGCGNGKTTAEIAKKIPNGSVVGIDNSLSMIEQAKKDFGGTLNLTFECIDAMEIAFKNQFDYVFSFSTFHWITDQQKAFNNIYQALKPGGTMIIRCGCDEDSPMKRAIVEVSNQAPWKEHFVKHPEKYNGASITDYKEMIKIAGFKNAKVELLYKVRPIEFNSFLDFLMGWMPYSTGLPTEEAYQFSKEITEHIFVQKHKAITDTIEYESPAAYIEAKKE